MENKPTNSKTQWGYLPDELLQDLRRRYWLNDKKRKSLMTDATQFPLHISLKPPRGNAALEDINHLQGFVAAWRRFALAHQDVSASLVVWEKRVYRAIAEQDIPVALHISHIKILAQLLGPNETQQLNDWQNRMAYLFDAFAALLTSDRQREQALFVTLVDYLDTLDKLTELDLNLLSQLIPQLKAGMGHGGYLRALPVVYVDTKFIEQNISIIESISTVLIDEMIQQIGLLTWLDCQTKPKDWLLIKPLCEHPRAALGGMPLLRLSSETLLEFELPARHILVIENEQSCLALDNIPNTIAVSGGGKNVAWMKAKWLTKKKVAYWGDIDSEGLSILSDVRSKHSSITPLLMDTATVQAYQERMVFEPDSVIKLPIALTEDEQALFNSLRAKRFTHTRLEQERLPMDYVNHVIQQWLGDWRS